MRGIHIKFKKYYLAILFAVVLVLLPTQVARADCGVIFSGSISDCVLEGTAYLLYLVYSVVGQMIAWGATLLNQVLNTPVYPANGIAVVDASWQIFRNFANMFFIVALILMAFG